MIEGHGHVQVEVRVHTHGDGHLGVVAGRHGHISCLLSSRSAVTAPCACRTGTEGGVLRWDLLGRLLLGHCHPVRSAAPVLPDRHRRFANKAPMALRFSGQADREGSRHPYSRSKIVPEWDRVPYRGTRLFHARSISRMSAG